MPPVSDVTAEICKRAMPSFLFAHLKSSEFLIDFNSQPQESTTIALALLYFRTHTEFYKNVLLLNKAQYTNKSVTINQCLASECNERMTLTVICLHIIVTQTCTAILADLKRQVFIYRRLLKILASVIPPGPPFSMKHKKLNSFVNSMIFTQYY